jgi:hypothetical protein
MAKRLQLLPRYLPSIILVDYDPQSFRNNPNNTIVLPPIGDFDPDDRDLFVVNDFIRLFRQLYRAKKVKTPQDAIQWLRQKHPEIDSDPARFMARAILHETEDARREHELMETESLGATLRRVQGETLIGRGKAVTAGSTRYQRVHTGSLVDDKIKRMRDSATARRKATAKMIEDQE